MATLRSARKSLRSSNAESTASVLSNLRPAARTEDALLQLDRHIGSDLFLYTLVASHICRASRCPEAATVLARLQRQLGKEFAEHIKANAALAGSLFLAIRLIDPDALFKRYEAGWEGHMDAIMRHLSGCADLDTNGVRQALLRTRARRGLEFCLDNPD